MLLMWAATCFRRGLRICWRNQPSRSKIPPHAETMGGIFSFSFCASLVGRRSVLFLLLIVFVGCVSGLSESVGGENAVKVLAEVDSYCVVGSF